LCALAAPTDAKLEQGFLIWSGEFQLGLVDLTG
jgi:hypothetical protein